MFHVTQMKAQFHCTSILIGHVTNKLLKHKEASFIHRKPEYLYGHSNLGSLETSGSIQSALLLPKTLVIVEAEEAVTELIPSRWWCEQDRVRGA